MFWQDHPKSYPLLILILGLYTLKFFALWMYRKKNKITGKDNFIIGINTIYYIFLSGLGFALIMVLLRVNIREFFTSISIIAAAIAIVSKDYIANAINGMILMFNSQVSIGDSIQIGTHKGKIVHISLLNLQLLNEEGELVYIPNTSVLTHDIINFTKSLSSNTSLKFVAKSNSIESIESLESYFVVALKGSKNIVEGSFELTVLSIKYDRIKLKAEADIYSRSVETESEFKKEIVKIWIDYLNSRQVK
jgi:small-conductance mechanosensitive channel